MARRAHGDYPAPHVNRKQRLFGSHVLDPPLAVHGFPWAGQAAATSCYWGRSGSHGGGPCYSPKRRETHPVVCSGLHSQIWRFPPPVDSQGRGRCLCFQLWRPPKSFSILKHYEISPGTAQHPGSRDGALSLSLRGPWAPGGWGRK